MSTIPFEKLPEAVTMLTKEVSELKRLLIEKQEATTTPEREQFLTIQEAAEFLSLSVPTLYSKVSRGELPSMKHGKRLYFSSIELSQCIKAGRKRSNNEIEQEADTYLSNNKKGLNNGK